MLISGVICVCEQSTNMINGFQQRTTRNTLTKRYKSTTNNQ